MMKKLHTWSARARLFAGKRRKRGYACTVRTVEIRVAPESHHKCMCAFD